MLQALNVDIGKGKFGKRGAEVARKGKNESSHACFGWNVWKNTEKDEAHGKKRGRKREKEQGLGKSSKLKGGGPKSRDLYGLDTRGRYGRIKWKVLGVEFPLTRGGSAEMEEN